MSNEFNKTATGPAPRNNTAPYQNQGGGPATNTLPPEAVGPPATQPPAAQQKGLFGLTPKQLLIGGIVAYLVFKK